jgi:hypothetical protein
MVTLHPQGRAGVHLSIAKYELVRAAILDILAAYGAYNFRDLDRAVGEKLGRFDGSLGWYTSNVKLDLEARGLIERIPGSMPQKLRLKRK